MGERKYLWDFIGGLSITAFGVAVFLATWSPEAVKAVPAPSQTGGPTVQAAGPCPSAPPGDTLNGTAGSEGCYVPGDATRPTAVQAANVTTDANGNWTVTWKRPFNSAVPMVLPVPINTGSLPMACNVATRSASGATGKCWQSTTNTLPGTLTGLGGLVVNPFATGAANAAVQVIGREPTQ